MDGEESEIYNQILQNRDNHPNRIFYNLQYLKVIVYYIYDLDNKTQLKVNAGIFISSIIQAWRLPQIKERTYHS